MDNPAQNRQLYDILEREADAMVKLQKTVMGLLISFIIYGGIIIGLLTAMTVAIVNHGR